MLRKIGGVIGGIALAFIIVQAAEMIVHVMFPPPPGMNMTNMAEMKAFVAKLPTTALLLVLLGWFVGTFAGTSAAAKIGHSRVPAYIVGAVLLGGGIANARMIPQPLWFTIASFVIFIVMTIAGSHVVLLPAPPAESRSIQPPA